MTNSSITADALATDEQQPTRAAADVSTTDRAIKAARNLRLVLRANAATSAISGAVGLAAASYWSERLGIDHVAITAAISVGLLLFAVMVAVASRLPADRLRTEALLISIGDLAWVGASAVVVAFGLLTAFGNVAAILVALVVADFAAMQLWLRRRL